VVATQLVPLNSLTGGAWVVVGLVDLGVILLLADVGVATWITAVAAGLLVGLVVLVTGLRAVRAAVAVATSAAGVSIASPATTFTVALFPVAIMVAMMLLVAVAAEPTWTVVVAAVFLGLGIAYLVLAWRARRVELAQGLIFIAPSNRLGLRRSPYALRLPR
jgi:hypothetical protein